MAPLKPKLILIVVASIALFLAARECYIRIRINVIDARINSLKIGMLEAEVIRILGGPGHAEEVSHVPGPDELFETKKYLIKGNKSDSKVVKRNYMFPWYREFLVSGGRTYILVDVYFSLETRQLLNVRKSFLTLR